MRPSRRSVLLVALLFTAGCLSAPPDGTSSSPTPTTASPSPTATTSANATVTATPPTHRAASNSPDPEKAVVVANEWDSVVEMRVRVVRDATNRTVHEATYTVDPGAERTAYDVATADPVGVESFTVVVTARDTTERVSIETSECYGDAYAEILDDGTLYLYYAIC
jgi:hypothetical protein